RLRFLSTALSSCASALLPLLSFPTRRSSDLTLWLLPFLESPLRDDGYDTADYFKVLPVHGDLDDFKAFLDEAHERGMRVITELVDRKSTRLNSSHVKSSYAVFCLKKKKIST